MNGILDRVAAKKHSAFQPHTALEFFALRLAQKLGEPEAAGHYLDLADQHSEGQLLTAYRRAVDQSDEAGILARDFHAALNQAGGAHAHLRPARLLALKSRDVPLAVAFFIDVHLDYSQIHHLPSAISKAEASVFGFLASMISHLKPESAAVELLPPKHATQRSAVNTMVETALTGDGLPIFRVDKKSLIASFGHPPPHSRNEVRQTVRGIWPVLGPEMGTVDAVALGLYVQTERSFVEDT